MKTCLIAIATLTAAALSHAETYTLTSAGSGKDAAWTDAQYWQDSNGQTGTAGDALDSEGTYKVAAGYALNVPEKAAAFAGGKIWLQNNNATLAMSASEVTVPGGIDFVQGYVQAKGNCVLNADIRTGHWNKLSRLTGPNGTGYSLTVNGDISATSTPNNPGDYYRNWHTIQPYTTGYLWSFNLNGDIRDANIYLNGRADVTEDGATRSGLIVTMGSASDIKTLLIGQSARIKAKSAADVITCAKLNLASSKEFSYWPKVDVKSGTASRLVVTNAYVATPEDGKIRIYASGDDVYEAAGVTEYPLFTLPTSLMPDESVFELSHDPAWTTESEFDIVDNGDGTSSVVVRFTPSIEIVAASATDVKSMAEFDLTPFGFVRYVAQADGTNATSSRLSVTTAFTRGTTPLAIRLEGDPIDYSSDQRTNRFELLVVPSATELAAGDIDFSYAAKWAIGVTTGVGDSVLEPGRKCFYATFPPMVRLVTSDTGGVTQNTGTTALKTDDPSAESPWSDGLWPHADADYVVTGTGMVLRTWTQYRKSGWTFPGRTLTIADGARFVNLISDDTVNCAGIRANYRLAGGVLENGKTTVAFFHGNVETVAGTLSRVQCSQQRATSLDGGALTGSGDLIFSGVQWCWTWTGGGINCKLDTSAFGGKIKVCLDCADKSTPTDVGGKRIELSIGGSFGAALPAFAADAIDLSEYTRVVPTSSIAVPASSNRGLTIGDTVYFEPPEGTSVSFGTPVANNGILCQRGAGTLALAGAMTSAAAAQVVVSNGTLRLGGAEAVKGAAVKFAAGTRLELAVNAGDADLEQTGVDLGDLAAPVVLDVSFGGKLPLAIVNAGGKADFMTGLFTCSAAAAPALRAMLPASVKLRGFVEAPIRERTDAETGRVTFYAEFVRSGTVLFFR